MHLPSEIDYITNVAYDSVIFGFSGSSLKILIMKYRNTELYALPGGFVRRSEDLSEAVIRGLRERTGLENIYLEQFHTFGSRKRNDFGTMRTILESNGLKPDPSYWMLDRFFSIAYYALINFHDVVARPDFLSDHIDWYNMGDLPPLMQDHEQIVELALQTLRENLDRKLIGGKLLPEQFTMKELQQVYEAILGTPLRRTTFQRRMLSLDILERHEKRYTGKPHKAPYLYSFKKQLV
jgi:ADP-ribose pyrophosphatase YjhB (NUDIX family)